MKLVVVGASGRMGRTLIRIIHETPGATLSAAVERPGSASLGQDSGLLSGIGENGIAVTDDPLSAFVSADGVLDFTAPAASVEFSELAAQARIVHVIGTTGCSVEDEAAMKAAARHARIVKSGNMSLGVNLLGVLVRQAARALPAAGWDLEILEMHHRHKVDAPPAPPSCSARKRPQAAASISPDTPSACVTDIRAPAPRAASASPPCAAAR